MNATKDQNQQRTAAEPSIELAHDDYDFDQWAKAVKRQMLASIKKREYKD